MILVPSLFGDCSLSLDLLLTLEDLSVYAMEGNIRLVEDYYSLGRCGAALFVASLCEYEFMFLRCFGFGGADNSSFYINFPNIFLFFLIRAD